MENLRKLNVYLGKEVEYVNKEMTDKEIDSTMEYTLGQMKKLFMQLPECLEKLTLGDLISVTLLDGDEEIGKTFMEKVFPDREPTEEEFEEAATGIMRCAEILGVDVSDLGDDP